MVINYVRIVLQCICKNAQFHESTLLISSDNGSILYGEDSFSACTLPENILLIIRKQCFHENRPSIKTTFIMDGNLKNNFLSTKLPISMDRTTILRPIGDLFPMVRR